MNKYIIHQTKSIREALVFLNQITSDTQSLLVVDEAQKLVGTLTDGDIRRGLISGAELSDSVSAIMHKDFKFILKSEFNVAQLKTFREKNILFIPVLDAERHIVDVVNLKKYKSRLPIDAVLMAGGKGERLRPLTEKTPKPLLPIGGKPIIEYIVKHIISYGIEDISVTINYLREQFEDYFSKPINGLTIKTVHEPKFLGTIGSVLYVDQFRNDTILLMNSDAITNIDLEEFYLHFKKHNADISVACIQYGVSVPYGIFEVNNQNITGILEKPTYNYQANSGIYLIKTKLLDMIPRDEFFNATDLIEVLIKKNYKVMSFPLDGTWLDIGNHQEYQKAKDMVKHIKSFSSL